MESLECGMESDKNFKKAEPKGKYCCVCKNYGGKIVDGEKVSLHRFPANEKENLVWRKRVQFVMVPGFKITKFSRLCSHHFVGKKGPQKPRITLPTLFAKKDFKTTAIYDNCIDAWLAETEHGRSCTRKQTLACGDSNPTTTSCDSNPTTTSCDSNPTTTSCDSNPTSSSLSNMEQVFDFEEDVCTLVTGPSVSSASWMMHDYVGVRTQEGAPGKANADNQVYTTVNLANAVTQTVYHSKTFKSTGTNTEISKGTVESSDVGTQYCATLLSVQCQANMPDLTFEDLEKDGKKKKNFYTGVPSAAVFKTLFDELSTDAKLLKKQVGSRKNIRYIDEFIFLAIKRTN